MDWQTLLGLIARHGLTTVAGSLVTAGWIGSGDKASFINIGAGIVVGAAGGIWSWWQKKGHAAVLAFMAKSQPVAKASDSTAVAVAKATEVAKAAGVA